MNIMTYAESVESIDDLLIKILLKLPLRSLFHCKLVSRRWRSIIVNWVLVLLVRRPNPAVGLFHPTGYQTYMYLCFDSKTKKDGPPFVGKCLFLNGSSWPTRIHQSCNGLLLCCKPDSLTYFPPIGLLRLWVYNPTTKRLAVLPLLSRPGVGISSVAAVNLAFDPSKSPFYKVVCVTRSSGGLGQVDIYNSAAEPKDWSLSGKPFDLNALCGGPEIFHRGVYWNSSIHWIDSSAREVLCFNVDEERFRKVPLPEAMKDLYDVEVRESYFGESCGHLHIAPMLRRGRLDVYEMEEDYSGWLFKCGIRTDRAPLCAKPSSMFCSVLSIIAHGDEEGSTFLFALMDNSVVVRYHLERGTHRVILCCKNKYAIPYTGLHGFQHMESLARV